MEKIIYAKIEYNIENGMVGAKFPIDIDYSNNVDYIKMMQLQNFYEATEEEYKLAISKQCIIENNTLIEYVTPPSVVLTQLKITKQNKIRILYANLLNRKVVWQFTFQGKQYSFTINGLENAILGIQQVQARLLRKTDIDADIANSNKTIFANIDTKYINTDIGYKSLYVDIFSNFIIDRVVLKVDNNNDVSAVNNLYNMWLEEISLNYNSENLTEFNRYIKDYYTKRDEIFALLDINSVENYDITIPDITLEIPESLIENVVLCCIL